MAPPRRPGTALRQGLRPDVSSDRLLHAGVMPTNVRYAALARLQDGVTLFSHKQNADAEVRRGLRGERRNMPAS